MRYNPIVLVYICLVSIPFCNDSIAEIKSGLCSPYYMSIKANKVNAHVGPGKDYRIKFEYILKGLPVIVVAKYDNWFKIEDPDRDYGWLHKSLLSPERFVISRNQDVAPIMSNSNDSSNIIARVSRNVVMKLRSIRGNWCKVELNYDGKKISGWINRGNVFGIMNNEG